MDLDRLVELYLRIENGSASDEDRTEYQLKLLRSCIKEDVLIKMIKDRASRMA